MKCRDTCSAAGREILVSEAAVSPNGRPSVLTLASRTAVSERSERPSYFFLDSSTLSAIFNAQTICFTEGWLL
jgi:hypothetical protein